MYTYRISVDETLIERALPAFEDKKAVRGWMQSQIESILIQMASSHARKPAAQKLSQRLRGIAAQAPRDFDYKKELEQRF